MKLFSYFYSSAAFRVRIALNLKGIEPDYVAVNLHPNAKEQLQRFRHLEILKVIDDAENKWKTFL